MLWHRWLYYIVRPHPFGLPDSRAELLAVATAPAVALVMAARWGSMLIVYTFLAALPDAHTRAHMPAHTHEQGMDGAADRQTDNRLRELLAWLAGAIQFSFIKVAFPLPPIEAWKISFRTCHARRIAKAIGIWEIEIWLQIEFGIGIVIEIAIAKLIRQKHNEIPPRAHYTVININIYILIN